MERILLVEPNYKNKYLPIGLMKISTYYKAKGDFVVFHKGIMPKNEAQTFDKILITTLFTFDFNMCIDTIRYYIEIVGKNRVFVGGIALTIMPDRFIKAIPGLNILEGQLTSSKQLGYDDDINIDILELDYDMLWDISYKYPAADSYFIYTSRGCPRKCSFCAVKTLEPLFYECNNIKEQILRVDQKYGTNAKMDDRRDAESVRTASHFPGVLSGLTMPYLLCKHIAVPRQPNELHQQCNAPGNFSLAKLVVCPE